ncbi:ZYRO0B13442p [Zygosaccharomyces rouxii]|uniref:2-(3-amino-3-carboxypropyl)histidine synthase subunit 2 n=1 Tax=Zygosaccharomyces rouxii (strain ATCC 2623 / CBS 732 / NBRC 1130 / NCYC 568 / NRRL Y-229) TaxID=559307 RepID=C5DS32_ZYGRC|nr:uncharacterized protein ZYRO0B13442g [Zygosaccharomyces rouxii]KAH9199878.1 putative diphthamide synthesis protein-domain-containing protein [Zygosaccharomyces rouxii]CAR26593.1 ZYRO0B13442p [Zygosaccharomyces rouxii]
MSESGAGDATVAPVLSTVADDDVFVLQKYETLEKERLFYLGPRCKDDLSGSIDEYYALDEIAQQLKRHADWRKITLQFPDSLVHDSSLVTQLLQDKFRDDDRQFWVVADTAYSACCVDEVASEHVSADVVVHFGDACLNAVQTLPVVYSFGRPQLDLSHVVNRFKEQYEKDDKVCLMANAPYTRHIRALYDELKSEYPNLIYAQINKNLLEHNCTIVGHNSEADAQREPIFSLGNRVLLADDAVEPISSKPMDAGYHLFYINIPQDPHLLFLTTQFQSVKLYDPKNADISQGPFPSLMKRYKYMHIARTAGCIGILVNTLSLRNTKETINALIELIRSNDKKHYLFVVGKPNVAKLANFEPVDIWCVLGCGQGGIILDQYNEFYKPIITPYELTLALNEEVTWTGNWVVDFKQVLNDIGKQIEQSDTNADSNGGVDSDEDKPEFDLVTGKSVSTSRPLRQLRHLELEAADGSSNNDSSTSSSQGLTQRSTNGGVIIKGTVSTSAGYLQNRAWSGLGSDFQGQEDFDEDGATVEEGRSGIASKYESDLQKAKRS